MKVQFGKLSSFRLIKLKKVLVCCWFRHSHPSTICSIALQQLVLEDRKHSYHYLFIFEGGKQLETTLRETHIKKILLFI